MYKTWNHNTFIAISAIFNINQVIDIIKGLKSNSEGWDSICAKVVKCSYDYFITPLTHICNL